MRKTRRRRVNKLRVIIVVSIFVAIVFGGSALLTRKPEKSQENGDLAKTNSAEQSANEDAEKTEESKAESTQEKTEEQKQENTETKQEEKKVDTSKPAKGKLPVANPNAVALCKQAQTGKEKNVYLTFDDGPSPDVTPQVLKILKEYNVPATFFLLGSRVELYPELVRQEYEEGHYLANHGYSHTYSSIYSSVDAVIDEYNQCENAIQNALGLRDFHSYLFRFPGGSSGGPYNDLKQEAKSTLESMGIASTNWNCLNGDAEGGKRSKERLIERLYETEEGWISLVVLMHDANDKQTTVDALPEIIEHYIAEGYTFKNFYDIFQ